MWSSALLLTAVPAFAYDLGDNLRVNGFGTLATTYTDSDSLGFRTSLAQDGETRWGWQSDSLIGIQLRSTLSDSLSATVQLVAKDRLDNDLNSSVEWAYLTYQSSDDWVARFGRVALDITLWGDVGSVGYAYDSVRPPTEFYSQIAIYSFDGADFTYHYRTDYGVFSTKVFSGITHCDYKPQDTEARFKLDPMIGIATRFESEHIIAKLGVNHSEFDGFSNSDVDTAKAFLQPYAGYSASVAETLAQMELDPYSVDFYSAGLVYKIDDWKILGEVAYLDSDSALYLPYFSAYAGVSKRIGNYAVYGLYSHGHTTRDSYQVPTSVPVSSAIQGIFDSVNSDQSTMSWGVRWDFASQVALKFQWDRSWIEQDSAYLWGRSSDEVAKQSVDVFTLSMKFIF